MEDRHHRRDELVVFDDSIVIGVGLLEDLEDRAGGKFEAAHLQQRRELHRVNDSVAIGVSDPKQFLEIRHQILRLVVVRVDRSGGLRDEGGLLAAFHNRHHRGDELLVIDYTIVVHIGGEDHLGDGVIVESEAA